MHFSGGNVFDIGEIEGVVESVRDRVSYFPVTETFGSGLSSGKKRLRSSVAFLFGSRMIGLPFWSDRVTAPPIGLFLDKILYSFHGLSTDSQRV